MKYPRYGKFRVTDYVGSWFGLIILMLFVAASFILKLSAAYIFVPASYSIALIYSICKPNRECFEISNDLIIIEKGNKKRQIKIPSELTLIISYVDICPPLARRNAVGNQTHILRGKYALSIFEKMDMEEVMERVHRNYIQRYTTSTIKSAFEEYRYIYSFVCNETLLNEIIQNRECNLLIPKSLFEKISWENGNIKIFVDPRC